MKSLAKFIVKYRYIFAALFLILTVASIFLIPLVKQNYDMAKYLSDDTDTKKGLAIMQDEFGLSNNISVMVTASEEECESYRNKLAQIEGVQLVSLSSYKDGKALFIVSVEGSEYSMDTKDVITDISNVMAGSEYYMSGSAVSSNELSQSLKVEIPIIMVIAIVIIFLVLMFTSHSWLEPIVFAIVLACAVVINMGTNIIFGEISYITFAVAAILQMALAMDYSIILLHGFSRYKDSGMSKEDALIETLAYNMRPISSSGLTTIAGLVALLFMSFTIGFDIGIVLAKGILISLLSVFLLLPALILIFDKALEKTAHKPVPVGGGGIAKISISMRAVLPIIFVVLIIGSAILQAGNEYTFTGWSNAEGDKMIGQTFGETNQAVLIFDNKYADDKDAQSKFVSSIKDLTNENGDPAFRSVNAWTNLAVSADSLTSSLTGATGDMSAAAPLLKAVFGSEQPTKDDFKRVWDECDGDIYNIVIPDEAIADMLSISESSRKNFYTILNALIPGSEGGKKLGDLIEKVGAIGDKFPLPENFAPIITLMINNRAEITEAANAVISSLFESGDGEQSDIMGKLPDTLCKMLFNGDSFLPYEFSLMWDESGGNIMNFTVTQNMIANVTDNKLAGFLFSVVKPTITQEADGRVTVERLLTFLYENKDNKYISERISPRILGACTLAYLFRSLYTDAINEAVDSMITGVRANFVGEEHSRIIMLMDVAKDDPSKVLDIVKQYAVNNFGENAILAGESSTINDVSDAFKNDLIVINLVTVISIFLIIGILFRSLSLPLLLVAIIQGAIWITMAIYKLMNIPIFFMSYIICVCIQMGATIDYGILIASNYRRNRATMQKYDAIVEALKTAMPTVLSSGLILLSAGVIIGFVSSVMPIASIGKLLGLGTGISMLLILFLLPAVLYIFDKIISVTTWDGIKPIKNDKIISKRKQKKLDKLAAEKKD